MIQKCEAVIQQLQGHSAVVKARHPLGLHLHAGACSPVPCGLQCIPTTRFHLPLCPCLCSSLPSFLTTAPSRVEQLENNAIDTCL